MLQFKSNKNYDKITVKFFLNFKYISQKFIYIKDILLFFIKGYQKFSTISHSYD